ncbi:MAG: hypothetical protein MSA25_09190 [Clostridiales bacterium]|nr:hypothetical protein [Clostridiales bacterium]
MAQIIIKSKADEKKYEFIKIGSYPKAGHPINQVEVNPMVLTVILGKAKLSDPWAPYEETICYRYKDFGMSQVTT